MNILLITRVDILNILILLTLLLFDHHYHKIDREKSQFTKFVFSVFLFAFLGLITEITVNLDSVPKVINDICHVAYFTFALLFLLTYFEYVLILILGHRKSRKYMIIAAGVSLISIILMNISDIEYLQGNGTKYSAGTGPTICYALGFLMFIVSDILLLLHARKLSKSITHTLIPISLVGSAFMVLQIIIPEFLFVESCLTLLTLGVFFSLENPISKYQERNALSRKIEVERTMFRDAITRNSLYQISLDLTTGMITDEVYDKYGNDVLAAEGLQVPCNFDDFANALLRRHVIEFSSPEAERCFSVEGVKQLYEDGVSTQNIEYYLRDEDVYYRLMPIIYVDPDTNHLMCFSTCEDITNQKKKSKELDDKLRKSIKASMTDELTGLFNRHAYDEAILLLEQNKYWARLVLASVDINGLKQTNDSLGHDAGDELLLGAARCLREGLEAYGKVYRIGGDEFAAILYMDENEIEETFERLNSICVKWRGESVKNLSVSYGFVRAAEVEGGRDIAVLQKLADERMYLRKDEYYRNTGNDRRGQGIAYEMICNSYKKILHVNLTTDTYDMIHAEQTEPADDMGYDKGSISKWLYAFAMSGQIHEEDKERYIQCTDLDYLRNFFLEGNEYYIIHYRRKVSREFKNVIMEMIPTKDYTKDNLSVFLYVKCVE